MSFSRPDTLDLLDDLVRRARRAGADAADAMASDGVSQSAGIRFGALERINRAESGRLGLRVLVGRRQAVVSSADRSPQALNELVERAVAMARLVPEDPFCGLAEPETLATSWPDLDLLDPVEPSPDVLADRARAMEEAALAVPGVVNSRSIEASWSRVAVALVTSEGSGGGFAGGYETSRHSLSALMLAGGEEGMERDWDHDSRTHAADLRDPAEVGRRAGERAARRLGARKIASRRVPVVFEARVAASLLGHLVGAVSGPAVARGTSFLKDAMGQAVLPTGYAVLDDPHRRRGPGSRPFDAEGAATRPLALVEDGRLASWLLDARSARQLGLPATGHATRGAGGLPYPAPSNLWLEAPAGAPGAEDLIGAVGDGLYVTELMGQGVNLVTGDYSRGASGLLIEGGRLTRPVSEVTIAGTLREMLARLEAAGDLDPRTGFDAPTLRIDGMTVAGR